MIAIIDYGMGNLASVYKAMLYIGQDAVVTSTPDMLLRADALILPGVGAISNAMSNLKASGLEEGIREAVQRRKPFLGICLGMQMLFDSSEESENGGTAAGLGILAGCVRKMPDFPAIKIPHMGWNQLEETKGGLFEEGRSVYFVHSYHAVPADDTIITSKAHHGICFAASVESGRILGMQFHPEKSGDVGLDILRAWTKSF
jgi:glutamine amidotransferase